MLDRHHRSGSFLDKQGRIRSQHFGGFDADTATAFIAKLLEAPAG